MTKVTIENREYELETLSEDAQAQISNIAYCDKRLQEIQREEAVLKTARASYAAVLRNALPKHS